MIKVSLSNMSLFPKIWYRRYGGVIGKSRHVTKGKTRDCARMVWCRCFCFVFDSGLGFGVKYSRFTTGCTVCSASPKPSFFVMWRDSPITVSNSPEFECSYSYPRNMLPGFTSIVGSQCSDIWKGKMSNKKSNFPKDNNIIRGLSRDRKCNKC